MYFPMYYDSSYILVIIGIVICLVASARMKSTFSKYSRVQSMSGMTGAQAAQRILSLSGISDVRIEHVNGNLSDHYDPRSKTLRLSSSTYGAGSVAAIGIAAHECGHAIQHARAYAPLTIRSALVPVANIGSMMAWPLILIGLFFSSKSSLLFLNIGILAFSVSVLFQFVTLPVEFNASKRATQILADSGILGAEETGMARKVLFAAALTYVAGAAASALQLLRLLMLGGRRSD